MARRGSLQRLRVGLGKTDMVWRGSVASSTSDSVVNRGTFTFLSPRKEGPTKHRVRVVCVLNEEVKPVDRALFSEGPRKDAGDMRHDWGVGREVAIC